MYCRGLASLMAEEQEGQERRSDSDTFLSELFFKQILLSQVTCAKPLSASKHLCLPRAYNKFDLPLPDQVNTIDIGIDIVDVLRINDKVRAFCERYFSHWPNFVRRIIKT